MCCKVCAFVCTILNLIMGEFSLKGFGVFSLNYFSVLPLSQIERLRNQRPTLVVTPDISTSVKEIWIGNVLLLETFLLKFLPAPEPFRRKDALGWVWGFFIYLSVGSFNDPEQGGGFSFRNIDATESRNVIMGSCFLC